MLAYREPSHYLKPLKSNTIPKRLLWLDCKGIASKEQGVFVDRWHVGALGSTHWTSKRGVRVDTLAPWSLASSLWIQADAFVKSGRRVVLFAYDLGYQLRVSQALIHLPALGWHLERIVLERTASWALFRSDDRSLMCCDLKSWIPAELPAIMDDLREAGHVYPVNRAGVDFQHKQCMNRCSIVRDAVLEVVQWLSAENLGPFRPTGSGQSYAAYRRRFMSHKLLVHDDHRRLEQERVAMFTGRCEAWKHGTLTHGPFIEYDMHAAYCHIAQDCEVPTTAASEMDKPSIRRLVNAMQTDAVLAECEITTERPCIPTHVGGRTVWPVGTFRTVIWDPEIRLALEYAQDFKCTRAYRYRRAPALRDFATFVLDGMADQMTVYGAVPARVMKHWSRCLVGRLGLRFRSWQKFGTQPEPDLRLITFIDMDDRTATDMLIAGYDRLILSELTEATESLPQIPSWVMSECRARLWNAMIWCGLDRIVYVDTDSIIVAADQDLGYADRLSDVLDTTWTRKGSYSRMTIHGPRNLVAESTRRVSGLPLSARQVAPLEFSGQVMRSIKESMRAGELDCVASIPRNFVLDAPDLRRVHLSNHQTEAYRLEPHAS